MAKTTVKPAVVETKIVEVSPVEVVLTLSVSEAAAVRALLGACCLADWDHAREVYLALDDLFDYCGSCPFLESITPIARSNYDLGPVIKTFRG